MTITPDFSEAQETKPSSKLTKKVSVIIPIYNAAPFLEEAVESVVREKEGGVKEIILIEDGSMDDSLSVALTLQEKYSHLVRLYRHPNGENRGAGASRNLGISRATGELICFLDADDYWLPGRLDEAVSLLEKATSLDGVYSPAIYRFETRSEEENFKNMPQLFGTIENICPDQLSNRAINGETIFHPNGILIRKHSLAKMKWFDESLLRGQDMEMILRMAAELKLGGTPSKKPVAVIRRHGNNRWDPSKGKVELEVLLAVFKNLYEWSVHSDIGCQYNKIILKRYFFLLGCAEQFSRAWQIACNIGRPWYILYAWRYRIPGPRTIGSIFRKVIIRQDT